MRKLLAQVARVLALLSSMWQRRPTSSTRNDFLAPLLIPLRSRRCVRACVCW